MTEKLFPAFIAAVCVVFMLRLLLGERLRWRFDSAMRRAWLRIKHVGQSIYHRRRSEKTAAEVAEEAIRRARDNGSWEGNVYKPKSFKRPPRDKLH
jgi:hypothetical protein